jgi:hypothetical protein
VTDDMSHPNRRAEDPNDGKRHLVQNAVESTFSKVLARYGVPILLGWMAWQGQKALTVQEQQGSDLAQVKSDVRVLSTRFDEVALRQVASNTDRIGQGEKKDIEQDRRLDALERTVPTP